MEIAITVLAIGVILLALLVVVLLKKMGDDRGTSSEGLRSELQVISQDTLSKVSEQFLNMAEQRFARQTETNTRELDSKKLLIDQQLVAMNGK